MGLAPIQLRNILRTRTNRAGGGERGNLALLLSLAPTAVLGLWTLWIYLSVGRLQQRLTTEQLDVTVKEAKETKIKATHDLAIQPLSSGRHYQGNFSISIENASRKRVEVSWVVFEMYVGKVSAEIAEDTVVSINEPPKHELNMEEPGVVSWRYQGSRGFLYPSSRSLTYEHFEAEKYFRRGGGLAKSLAPGELAAYSMPVFVNSAPKSWIAVVAILGLDGTEDGDSVLVYSDWVELPDVQSPPSESGAVAR